MMLSHRDLHHPEFPEGQVIPLDPALIHRQEGWEEPQHLLSSPPLLTAQPHLDLHLAECPGDQVAPLNLDLNQHHQRWEEPQPLFQDPLIRQAESSLRFS